MSRLLADEHFPQAIVHALRLLGHEVTPLRHFCKDKAGDGINDDWVLELARSRQLAVVTKNVKHFLPLHRQRPWHYGIIACSFPDDEAPKKVAQAIDTELKKQRRLQGVWIRVCLARDAL